MQIFLNFFAENFTTNLQSTPMKSTIRKIALTLMSLFAAATAFAQVTTSSISGKITDENGADIAGATVIAVHVPSGTQYWTIADSKGNYRILNILPGGPYTVRVEMLGFKVTEVTGVNVALADNFVVNTTLEEESMDLDEVVVVAESVTSNMRSDRAGAVTSVDLKSISNIPVISRDVQDIIKLTPQAYDSGNGPQIGGGTYRQNNFTIDGAAANNAFGIGGTMPANGSPISMDAIEQISVNVTPFDVRQSGFIGAAMNAVTRSGNNNFEASAYSYFYNEKFRGKYVEGNELTVNPEQHLLVGARVGGPIIKDKLFFFLNFEMERDVEPGPSRRASTSANPYTDGNDGIARPSESVMNALSDYLINQWGYNPGAYQGYSTISPAYKFLARIDWNINNNHKLNIRYNMTQSKSPIAPSTSTSGLGDRNFTINSRTAMTALYFQNARYFQENNYSSIVAELNSRFLDGKVNNVLRATYSHQYEPRSTEGGMFPFVDLVVGDNIYTSFGTELFSLGNLRDVNTVTVTDEVTASLGINQLTAGVQYEWNRTKNGFQRFGAGYYTFEFDTEADLMNAINSNTLFDNPYQYAITHSFNSDWSQAFPQFDFHQVSLYLQNEMSFNRFKLSYGLRVELPMYPDLGIMENPQVSEGTFMDYNGNGGKYSTLQLPATSVMFSPRIGFNWDILGDRSLVLRGGSGFFTGRLPFVWIVAQAGDAGVIQATYNGVQGKGVVPPFIVDRTEQLNTLYPNGVTPGAASISSISLMAPDLKMPQTWKSSLALDYILPGDVMLSVEGVYNYDINPVTITNVGLKDPVYSNINNFADNRYVWGDYYEPSLQEVYLLNNSKKGGHYYSVTAKAEKRNFYGFDGMIAYTYSNALSYGDGWGDQVYSAWQNAATVNGQNFVELGYAGYVMPHRLIASLSYTAEYARNFATGISLFYEGGPRGRYSYTYTSNIVGDGGADNLIYVPASKDELTFADYTPDGADWVYTAEEQAEDFWNFINDSKYLSTRKGQYAERNGLVAPWTHQFDVRIFQNFYVYQKNGQRHTIQIGLDIENIGNLFNQNWGHFWSANNTSILRVAQNGYTPGGVGQSPKPVYNFMTNGLERLTSEFSPSISLSSTWMMQLSLRWIFQ